MGQVSSQGMPGAVLPRPPRFEAPISRQGTLWWFVSTSTQASFSGGPLGSTCTLRASPRICRNAARGDYQAYMAIWNGRPDPDGNLGIWMRCGAPLNWTACRRAGDLWMTDLAYLPLYHLTWLWGLGNKVADSSPRPDGLVRPIGLSLRP